MNKTKLSEADYLDKIGQYIDKHIKSGNKSTPAIADLQNFVQNRISSHKDIGLTKSKKVLQKGYDDKLNEEEKLSSVEKSNYFQKITQFIDKLLKSKGDSNKTKEELKAALEKYIASPDFASRQMDYSDNLYGNNFMGESKTTLPKNDKVSNKDLKQLLEFIYEADKASKKDDSESKKKENKPKQQDKPKKDSEDESSKKEVASPSSMVSALLKSSGFSNFTQDASRTSSKKDKADAYIQMMSSLPSINDPAIRRAIINKLKTKND
jgi:hypothetical protein